MPSTVMVVCIRYIYRGWGYMNIFIKVQSLTKTTELSIDTELGTCICNGVSKSIDTMSFLTKLQTIIAPWQYEMVNDGVIDGESYTIELRLPKKLRRYIGRNRFPLNYGDFKSLLSEVENASN